jgi:hypothetical protein
MKEP